MHEDNPRPSRVIQAPLLRRDTFQSEMSASLRSFARRDPQYPVDSLA